jgi:hypothetical protein
MKEIGTLHVSCLEMRNTMKDMLDGRLIDCESVFFTPVDRFRGEGGETEVTEDKGDGGEVR